MPPYNGSGSFTPYVPGNPVVTGTVISSTAYNATQQDIAAGLSNAVTRDGQSPLTANLPAAGRKITGLGPGVVAGDSVRFEQLESLVSLTGNQTIAGVKTFSSAPVLPADSISTAAIQNDAVTFSKMQNVATASILGRSTAGTGDVEALTGAQATALLVAASETVSGRVELATNAEAQTGTDATRAVTPANLSAALLGMGQTWQNVLGSRVAGTTYTNTTGRTIAVCIMLYSTVGQQTLTVSGVVVWRNGGPPTTNVRDYFSVLVPPGATYVLSAAGAFVEVWSELR